MKYLLISALLMLLVSCTGNESYTIMYSDGQICEATNSMNITYKQGDSVIVCTFIGKSPLISRTIYGKYINNIPNNQTSYGKDSFLYASVYDIAIIQ